MLMTDLPDRMGGDASIQNVDNVDLSGSFDEDVSIPMVAMEDVWATSEGYTPLQDFLTNNDNEVVGGAFFCDGTSGGTIYTSFPGAFYANIATLNENDESVEDDEYRDYNYLQNYNDEDDDLEATTATSSTSLYDSIQDYRSVAHSALLMLDREYQNTVSLQQPSSISFPRVHSASTHENESELQYLNAGEINFVEPDSLLNNGVEVTEMKATTAFEQQPDKSMPSIDAEAVRRAVQTIQLKSPHLEQNLRVWESRQRQQQKKSAAPAMYVRNNKKVNAPRLHPIIPETPLTAFRTLSNKAIQATANLTRSACIAECLRRFDVLKYTVGHEQHVNVHVLGCDHVECGYHTSLNGQQCDVARIRKMFGPIVRWMGAYAEAPEQINIELIGPNIPISCTSVMIDLMPNNKSSFKECLKSANLRCHSGTYEDVLQDGSTYLCQPDIIIAFNAGLWGYHEWTKTIQFLVQRKGPSIPFVVTAYTVEEAEDDYDVIEQIVKVHSVQDKEISCEWDVEHNPFSSNEKRFTSTSTDSKRSFNHENAAWQAWRL